MKVNENTAGVLSHLLENLSCRWKESEMGDKVHQEEMVLVVLYNAKSDHFSHESGDRKGLRHH